MSPGTRPKRISKKPARLSEIENGYSEESVENVRETGAPGLGNLGAPCDDMDISDSDCSFNADKFEADHMQQSSECGLCGRLVEDNDEGVQCDGLCKSWVHRVCGGISPARYQRMVKEEEWLCPGPTCHPMYIMTLITDGDTIVLITSLTSSISSSFQ